MKNIVPLITVLFLALGTIAAFKHKGVLPVNYEQTPMRIISLAPSITESIYYLGAGERLIAVTRYCNYPSEASALPKVGGILDINYEAIASMKPDMVVLTDFDKDIDKRLNSLGVRTLTLNHQSLEGVINSFKLLADALSIEADAKISELTKAVEHALNLRDNSTQLKVLFSVFRTQGEITKLTVAGRDGYFDKILSLLNLENPFKDEQPYITITREGLYRVKPDMIIELIYEEGAERYFQKDWEDLGAKNVCIISGSYGYTPGPRFKMLLEKIEECLEKI